MDYRHRQLATLDDDLSTGAHARQHVGEVAGRFFFGDMDYSIRHVAIIPPSVHIGEAEVKYFVVPSGPNS